MPCPAGQLLLRRGNPQSDPHNPHYPLKSLLEDVKAGTRRGKTFKEPTEQKQRARARSHNLYVRRVLIYCPRHRPIYPFQLKSQIS